MQYPTLVALFALLTPAFADKASTTKLPIFWYVDDAYGSVITANPTATVIDVDLGHYEDEYYYYSAAYTVTIGPSTLQGVGVYDDYTISASCDITRTVEATCVEETIYQTYAIDYEHAVMSEYVDEDGTTYTDIYDYDYLTTVTTRTTTKTFEKRDMSFGIITVTAGLDKLAEATAEADVTALSIPSPTGSEARVTNPAETAGSTPTGSAPGASPSDGAAASTYARGASFAGLFGMLAAVFVL